MLRPVAKRELGKQIDKHLKKLFNWEDDDTPDSSQTAPSPEDGMGSTQENTLEKSLKRWFGSDDKADTPQKGSSSQSAPTTGDAPDSQSNESIKNFEDKMEKNLKRWFGSDDNK